MKTEHYHYGSKKHKLVILPGKIFGPLGKQNISLVFDPGSYRTILSAELTDFLGYQATTQSKKISTTSVTGKEYGYTLLISQLNILGFEFRNIEIACFDLPEKYEIDGLLGLDLLEKFEVTLQHKDRWIEFRLLDSAEN